MDASCEAWPGAAGADANQRDLDLVELRRGEAAHVLRAGRAGRRGLRAPDQGVRGHCGGDAAEELEETATLLLFGCVGLHDDVVAEPVHEGLADVADLAT